MRVRAKKFQPRVDRTKFVTVPKGYNKLHIELPGCVVNIEIGQQNDDWEDIVLISVTANGDRYAGEREWWIAWGQNDYKGGGCRIIREIPGSEFSQKRKQSLIVGALVGKEA